MTEPAGAPAAPASTGRWRTRGQPAALAAIAQMVAGTAPHAVLLAGPPAVGKTTLAEDLAAGLLCIAVEPSGRPCRACRACRIVTAGNHPDLHRLVPEGPGGQIVIGDDRDVRGPRGVRDLIRELALLSVEGGHRVAIIEGASQMNEDAQNALLKTLEEPPAGVTIVLCVDREELLLPTVRSRCAKVRLGPVATREIEGLLEDLGLADASLGASLARLAEGRPGVAVAYARAPEAAAIRAEIARSLLDLIPAGRSLRLAAGRDLLGRARDLAEALAGSAVAPLPSSPGPPRGRGRPRSTAGVAPVASDQAGGAADALGAAASASVAGAEPAADGDGAETVAGPRLAPAERRRAARQLLAIWRAVARDLAVAELGGRRAVHDIALLEEVEAAVSGLEPGSAGAFLARLDDVAELVAGNVAPELAVDVLLMAWPSAKAAAA